MKKIKNTNDPPPTPAREAAREARPVGSLPSVRIAWDSLRIHIGSPHILLAG